MLAQDPNDASAFQALAEIVRSRAVTPAADDPLSGRQDEGERRRAADLAVWSLAEELAGRPHAWYPLIELARLSLHEDHEGALRRLTTATDRDPSGVALVEALAVLRDAGQPVEALNLGVGHWRVKEHTPEVARQLVLAALEADRPMDAAQHLRALQLHPDTAAVERLRPDLDRIVARAEHHFPRT